MRKSPQKRVVKAGSYQFRKKMTPWCILFFPMAFTVWLKYYPIVSAFFISLFRYDPINPPGKFVGFENYVDIFHMQHYWDSWKNTFILLVLQLCSNIGQCNHMEVDLASGLWCCKSNCEIFWWRAPDMVE